MGSNINPANLLVERRLILDKILEDLRTWKGDIESGLDLVDANEKQLDQVKAINLKLEDLSQKEIDREDYERRLNLIIEEQRKLSMGLESKQKDLLHNFKQLGERKNVLDNYVSNKRQSIFIDKDL